MTKADLAQKLNNMYYNAPKGEKVSMIHLFGIKYSEEIKESNASTKEIAKAANINESYGTEISKGVKLGHYVDIKPTI
jgi:5-methylcytosine-specific restriction protein B